MIRSILVLAVLALSLGACSSRIGDQKKKAEEACAKVTNENWRNSDWAETMTSKVQCESAYSFLSVSGTRPCTFGGMPFMCFTKEDNTIVVRNFGGTFALEITRSNSARTEGHLKIID